VQNGGWGFGVLELNFSFRRDAFSLQAEQTLDMPITGILGASGSGKSTLLALIAGLLKPQQGSIRLDQKILCDSQQKIWVPPHQRHIGLVFQDGQLLPHLSVRQNLLYGYNNLQPDQRRFSLSTIVDLLEISVLLDRRPGALSGGEKQRVALGRAVLYSPELLLLDEPLSALDERLKQQILPFFLRIYAECKIPMIYVTHAVSEVNYLTDSQLRVENGELVKPGSMA
jgi:molybdate transport system ATP-binding protein